MNCNLIYYLVILFSLISCSNQQKIISKENLNIINITNNGNTCNEEVIIYNNFNDFDQFQKSLIIPGERNNPLQIVDFSNKNLAVICKENIEQYEISELKIAKKNTLKMTKVNDEFDNSINLIILEIPKEINYLTLEYL